MELEFKLEPSSRSRESQSVVGMIQYGVRRNLNKYQSSLYALDAYRDALDKHMARQCEEGYLMLQTKRDGWQANNSIYLLAVPRSAADVQSRFEDYGTDHLVEIRNHYHIH